MPSDPRTKQTGPSATGKSNTVCGGVTGEPDGPNASALEFLQRRGQTRHHRDREVLDRAGRGFRHRRGDVGGAVAGKHETGRAGRLGAADDGAEVVRIGDAVERDKERRRAPGRVGRGERRQVGFG